MRQGPAGMMAVGMVVVTVLGVAGYAQESETAATESVAFTEADRAKFDTLCQKPIHKMSNVDLADYLSLRTRADQNGVTRAAPRDEMGQLAKRSIGMPYRLNAVQFDLAESDCVAFVNRALAMSVATDWDSYVLVIERLRHKDGVVEYRNRNFLTLGDWLPNNSWLLRDVTRDLGATDSRPVQQFTHVVRPKVFVERPAAEGSKFTRITYQGMDYKSGTKEVRTDWYLPADKIADVAKDIKTGDVVLVLRKRWGGYFDCEHMGLLTVENGQVYILHCAPPSVVHEPISSFLTRCRWVVGIKCLRLRDDACSLAAEQAAFVGEQTKVNSAAKMDEKVTRLRASRSALSAE